MEQMGGGVTPRPVTPEEQATAKGDCYEAALYVVLDMPDDAEVCHGTVVGNGPKTMGIRFGHAWVEWHGIVFDHSNGRVVIGPRDTYYRVGQVADVKRYRRRDIMDRVYRAGHCGPDWNVPPKED